MTTNVSPGDASTYPLYNTSFTLHRVSPLYHGSSTPLLEDAPLLAQHARRFRDILKGEVLRGVHVGLVVGDDGLSKAGSLIDVRWEVLEDAKAWARTRRRRRRGGDARSDTSGERARGLRVDIEYERARYAAILLRRTERHEAALREGFTALPLLLTRMPNPLRERLIDYLSTAFDVRCSALKLSSAFLSSSLESYLQTLAEYAGTEDGGSPAGPAMRDVNLTLTFPPPVAPYLKTLALVIPAADVSQFLEEGRRRLGLDSADRQARAESETLSPIFTTALSAYTSAHLAMPLSASTPTTISTIQPAKQGTDPSMIRVSRIACGGFVLSTEGKVKIFSPAPAARPRRRAPHGSDSDGEDGDDAAWEATERVVDGLVRRAEGEGLGLALS